MSVLFFLCLCLFLSSGNPEKTINGFNRIEEKKLKTDVDNTIEHLENEVWLDHERPCLEKMTNLLHNVKNFTLSAVWIWDSIQQPVGILYGSRTQLGNYDQCLKMPRFEESEFRTQYCLAEIKLTDQLKSTPVKRKDVMNFYDSAESYIKRASKYGRDFTTITWGVCLPVECQPGSVSKILRILFMRSHLSPLRNSNITVTFCEKDSQLPYSNGFYIFITMTCFIIIVAILSTLYTSMFMKSQTHTSTRKYILKSFDLVRNYKKLTEVRDDDIPILHLTKSFTALGAVLGHQLHLSAYGVMNGLDIEKNLENQTFVLLRHFGLFLDHFIVISGLLLMKNLMEKEQNLIYLIIKRYIRLMGPAAIMIFYFTVASPYMGSGPLWSKLNGREQEACAQNWWLIPLMLNNYVNTKDMCQVVYWYIPCDFQLAVFGTLMFFIFKKTRMGGWILVIAVSVMSAIIPGLTTFWNKFPVGIFYDIEKTLDLRKSEHFMGIYIKSHQRSGRYLIGMAMGYFMSTRRPFNYRRIINEKWSSIIFAINCLFGVSIALISGLVIDMEYDATEAAIFVGITNIAYAVCICITIFVFEYGTIPFITEVPKLKFITVLSRLSYCIYLIHIAIVQRNVFSTRGPGKFDISVIPDGLGVCVLTVIIGFVMWLLIEAPLSSLTNSLLTSKTHGRKSEGTKSGKISYLEHNMLSNINGKENGVENKKHL